MQTRTGTNFLFGVHNNQIDWGIKIVVRAVGGLNEKGSESLGR